MARWFGCRIIKLNSTPIISFTFDDFPRSALHMGGSILQEHRIRGTYYTSFGLMGQSGPTGEIFSREDTQEFVSQGHELGCHTYDHFDAWETSPSEFEASILRNQQAAQHELPRLPLSTLSYPISYPRPRTKCRTAKYYDCARGGGQTFNAGDTDLNYLKAFFLEQSRDDIDAVKRLIDATVKANGWLIFATHDVSKSPTRFGCTPEFFEDVVEYSAESKATVLPVHEALCALAS